MKNAPFYIMTFAKSFYPRLTNENYVARIQISTLLNFMCCSQHHGAIYFFPKSSLKSNPFQKEIVYFSKLRVLYTFQ